MNAEAYHFGGFGRADAAAEEARERLQEDHEYGEHEWNRDLYCPLCQRMDDDPRWLDSDDARDRRDDR